MDLNRFLNWRLDTIIGSEMREGISGRERKHVTTNNIPPRLRWCYYLSPMMYGQNAIVMNEFLDQRWSRHELQIPLALNFPFPLFHQAQQRMGNEWPWSRG
ncbi:Pleiotropic drug resistance protein [Senna tora]|uniref:Pleiotropic drug resistance protein n=1 Tax=Senna tora TaxID=362788 RepID=A0A834SEZ4_9FABA|nr:Pleiotropic drug resistance protein [Senna tora]